jgi:uncharacterized phage protein (TIGR02220 family)
MDSPCIDLGEEEEKEQEKENNNIPYADIISYLNEKAGTKYRHTTDKNKELIKARWNDGFRLDDFKTVIDKKTAEWLNTDNAVYLRPITIFGTKFESYLNQLGQKQDKPKILDREEQFKRWIKEGNDPNEFIHQQ